MGRANQAFAKDAETCTLTATPSRWLPLTQNERLTCFSDETAEVEPEGLSLIILRDRQDNLHFVWPAIGRNSDGI